MQGISHHNDQVASQALGSGALSFIASYTKRFKLDEVLFSFSQAVYETTTVTLISSKGTNYNTVLEQYTLGGETSHVFRPTGEANFNAGDMIQCQCTNANGIGTVYCAVKSSMLGSGS